MMCYRDKTFCEATDCKNFGPCPRSLTDKVRADAGRWWAHGGGDPDDAPISRFFGKPQCFEPKEATNG